MTFLVHMGSILPLLTSALSGGNNYFHLLLSSLLQHCIVVIRSIRKVFVRRELDKLASDRSRTAYAQ